MLSSTPYLYPLPSFFHLAQQSAADIMLTGRWFGSFLEPRGKYPVLFKPLQVLNHVTEPSPSMVEEVRSYSGKRKTTSAIAMKMKSLKSQPIHNKSDVYQCGQLHLSRHIHPVLYLSDLENNVERPIHILKFLEIDCEQWIRAQFVSCLHATLEKKIRQIMHTRHRRTP